MESLHQKKVEDPSPIRKRSKLLQVHTKHHYGTAWNQSQRLAHKKSFPSRQRPSSFLCSSGCEIDKVRDPTCSFLLLLSSFGFLKLLSGHQFDKKSSEKEILFKRGCNCRNDYVFCEIEPNLLLGWDQQIGAVLDKVCNIEESLSWKIKMGYPKKLRTFHFCTSFSYHSHILRVILKKRFFRK